MIQLKEIELFIFFKLALLGLVYNVVKFHLNKFNCKFNPCVPSQEINPMKSKVSANPNTMSVPQRVFLAKNPNSNMFTARMGKRKRSGGQGMKMNSCENW